MHQSAADLVLLGAVASASTFISSSLCTSLSSYPPTCSNFAILHPTDLELLLHALWCLLKLSSRSSSHVLVLRQTRSCLPRYGSSTLESSGLALLDCSLGQADESRVLVPVRLNVPRRF